MNAAWMIPFIVAGGALQTCGAAMNGQVLGRFGSRLAEEWSAE